MGRGSSKANGGSARTAAPMTQETRFDGLLTSEASNSRGTTYRLQTESEDGSKIAVVLDRETIHTEYDRLMNPTYYAMTDDNHGVRLEEWQVSAVGSTSDARGAQARVVIMDSSNFNPVEVNTRYPFYEGAGVNLSFNDFRQRARAQAQNGTDIYGMGSYIGGAAEPHYELNFKPSFGESVRRRR